jgi:tyrosyl-DNA phosphodiesterase-1
MIIAMLQENSLAGKRKEGEQSDTEDDTDDDIEVIEPAQGWAYVGSHNFTPSAWGTLSGSAFNPTLNVSCRGFLHFLNELLILVVDLEL